MDDHLTIGNDAEFEVELHPAFASRVTIGKNGEAARELYKQQGVHHLNGKKHPKKHRIRLKGKNGRRDLTLSIDDPDYLVAKITVELYPEGHDPESEVKQESEMTFTIMNDPLTCPPVCGPPSGGP
jgi:hypothetical protein